MGEPIRLQFEITDVANKFLLQIKETTECVSRIYQAIDSVSDSLLHKPAPTENLPIFINDNEPIPTPIVLRQKVLAWTLCKGFEDNIIGLTKSFKEVYRFLAIRKLASEKSFKYTEVQFQEEFQKIERDIEKFHIPQFISKIEELIGKDIPLKKELLSFNRVRNCLVHRHGLVNEKDILNGENRLNLYWKAIKSWSIIDGKKVYITYDNRKQGILITNISHEIVDCEKSFSKGELVSLDIHEFNGIASTCVQFAQAIFDLMPKEDIG